MSSSIGININHDLEIEESSAETMQEPLCEKINSPNATTGKKMQYSREN